MARILVIDDSRVIRDLLGEFLTEEGHSVLCASDSRSGLALAQQSPFDLCFCDMHVPDGDGYHTFREIIKHQPNLTFIFTDSLPDRTSAKVRELPGHFYLRKPFDLQQLRDTLAQCTVRTRVS